MTKPLDRSLPPPDCDKHILFRGLLRRPRPQRALSFRVTGAERIPLFVRGMKSIEYAEVFESGDEVEISQLAVSTITAELISAVVFTRNCRAFSDADAVMRLSGAEIGQLGKEVLDVVHLISPTYQRSDAQAWRMALKEGAGHRSNIYEAMSMYRSCDRIGMDATVYERPDRYFGLPVCELTDGQLMAYAAAVEFVSSSIGSPDE